MHLLSALLLSASFRGIVAPKPTSAGTGGPGGPSGGGPPPSEPSFTDAITTLDSSRWATAHGWSNGSPFWNGWSSSAVGFDVDGMTITLDDTSFSSNGKTYPYTSGELRTTSFYGYGCYEVWMKPVKESGVVTAFFTFAGPYDNPTGGNGQHNEIDIEFLGKNTSEFQANYWTNDDSYSNGHEHIIDLGFDASLAFHRYGFKWTSTGIEWYVDGAMVHSVADSPSDPVPKIEDTTHKIMMNLWPVDNTASGWAGTFTYPGSPLDGQWHDVSFVDGESCVMAGPSSTTTTAATPTGSTTTTTTTTVLSNSVRVGSINMVLQKNDKQGVATVAVLDAGDQPVSGAEVIGAWTELAAGKGETDAVTDPSGEATLYSANTNAQGTFTFCVSDIMAGGLTFVPGANDCGSIDNF